MQRATGHSTWDIPTEPALSVPTPDPTPQQAMDPFQKPPGAATGTPGPEVSAATRGQESGDPSYQGADRSLLSVGVWTADTGMKCY